MAIGSYTLIVTLSVQSSSVVQSQVVSDTTPWTAAHQASLSFTIPWSLLKLTSIELVGNAIQPSHPLSSPSPFAFNLSQHQSLFQRISSCFRWLKYWSFSFSISPYNELVQFSSVAQPCPTLQPHEPQHARPPCPLPTPGVHPNRCLYSR